MRVDPPTLEQMLVLCDAKHARRLRILWAHRAGTPLRAKVVMERFAISKATANRDIAAVRLALLSEARA